MSSNDTRAQIAYEAARLLCEQGYKDYAAAKNKAAAAFGAPRNALPSNVDIEQAVRSYLELSVDADARHRHALEVAIQAMQMLERFNPRLVGSVLVGAFTPFSTLTLHVFAEALEEIDFFLGDCKIPFQSGERRMVLSQREVFIPTCEFFAGEVEIELAVFSTRSLQTAAPNGVDGRPMRRASIQEARQLLANYS